MLRNVIICRRPARRQVKRCMQAGCGMEASYQCDAIVSEDGKTCDAYICFRHAFGLGPGRDVCPRHFEMTEAT